MPLRVHFSQLGVSLTCRGELQSASQESFILSVGEMFRKKQKGVNIIYLASKSGW